MQLRGINDLGRDVLEARSTEHRLERHQRGLSLCSLFSGKHVDARSVGRAHVVALPHALSWIVVLPEDLQQLLIRNLGRIERNQHHFVVAGAPGTRLFIGRVGRPPRGVSNHGRHDARGLPELALGAPKTAHPKHCDLDAIAKGRLKRRPVHVVTRGERLTLSPTGQRVFAGRNGCGFAKAKESHGYRVRERDPYRAGDRPKFVHMLHVRVVTPPDQRPALLDQLEANDAVLNIMVFPNVARRPAGDVVQFDVAREAANQVIAGLRRLDLHRTGSIAIEQVDTALSDAAAAAEEFAPGDSSEAVIWEEVEARLRNESSLSISFVAMMSIAVLIAAVGVITDSPVLIVGAMVVGPDYGPLAAVTLWIHRRRWSRAALALKTLLVGYGIALLAALVLGVVVRLLGEFPPAYKQGVRPLTTFVSRPDGWSVVIAILAGIAGMIAMTEAKAGTIVGVLISVTTIPAAGNLGVAIAVGRPGEAVGSAVQLLLNLVLMVATGLAVLRIQHRALREPPHH